MRAKLLSTLGVGACLLWATNCSTEEGLEAKQTAAPELETQTVEALPKLVRYSGEQYFQGIFFMRGKVAGDIAMYKEKGDVYANMTDEQLEEQNKLQTLIMNQIREDDPEFFAYFQHEMETGDHLRIQDALDRGGKAIGTAAMKIPELEEIVGSLDFSKVKPEEVMGEDGNLDMQKVYSIVDRNVEANPVVAALCGPTVCAIALAVYFVVAVHNALAVTASVAVALTFWRWVGVTEEVGGPSTTKVSTLENEMLINDIAVSFS